MYKRIVAAAGSAPGESLLEAARQLIARGGEIHSFHVHSTKFGDTLDALLEHLAATSADLVVLGARGHNMARRVAMLAPCPVLMIPDGSQLKLDRILVPVDFSVTAAEALREAVRVAPGTESSVTVVAIETDEDDAWLDWRDEPGLSERELREFITQAVGPGHRCDWLIEPAHGFDTASPQGVQNVEGALTAGSVIAVARRLDSTLIVAGTRGRTRAAAALFGSVVEKIVQISHLPVLAVRRPGERLGLLAAIEARLRDNPRPLVAG